MDMTISSSPYVLMSLILILILIGYDMNDTIHPSLSIAGVSSRLFNLLILELYQVDPTEQSIRSIENKIESVSRNRRSSQRPQIPYNSLAQNYKVKLQYRFLRSILEMIAKNSGNLTWSFLFAERIRFAFKLFPIYICQILPYEWPNLKIQHQRISQRNTVVNNSYRLYSEIDPIP